MTSIVSCKVNWYSTLSEVPLSRIPAGYGRCDGLQRGQEDEVVSG